MSIGRAPRHSGRPPERNPEGAGIFCVVGSSKGSSVEHRYGLRPSPAYAAKSLRRRRFHLRKSCSNHTKENPAQRAGFVLSGSASSRALNRDCSRVSTDSIVSCGPFQGPLAPFQKGPDLYRRWRVFHAESSCWRSSTRAEPSRRSRILEGASSVRSNRPSRWRSTGDSAPRSYTRETPRHQAAECSSAKKLNARWPRASTHKSRLSKGENAVMARFGGLTNCFFYSFRDSITAGWVIFPPRTFKPLAKPGSAASAASTP